jgi:hypothetical protein
MLWKQERKAGVPPIMNIANKSVDLPISWLAHEMCVEIAHKVNARGRYKALAWRRPFGRVL